MKSSDSSSSHWILSAICDSSLAVFISHFLFSGILRQVPCTRYKAAVIGAKKYIAINGFSSKLHQLPSNYWKSLDSCSVAFRYIELFGYPVLRTAILLCHVEYEPKTWIHQNTKPWALQAFDFTVLLCFVLNIRATSAAMLMTESTETEEIWQIVRLQ